jgi:hypothetical protein
MLFVTNFFIGVLVRIILGMSLTVIVGWTLMKGVQIAQKPTRTPTTTTLGIRVRPDIGTGKVVIVIL